MSDLVIGGSGFVGRNLIRRLEAHGREVVCVDRVPDSTSSFTGTFIAGDASNPQFLDSVLRELQPEVVYHLAANSDISAGIGDASLDFGDTLMTTLALRSAVERTPVEKIVFASSSAIFGVSEYAFAETSESVPDPVSWYGKAKLASEYVLESLAWADSSAKILMVRFPNVVGPLATHGVVFDFVRKLLSDPHQLAVLGDGFQTKPYLHVSELIDGIQFFLETLEKGITRINMGPTDLVSVREIAEEVARATGTNPDFTYQQTPFGWPGDVPRYSFDTAKMKSAGFTINSTSRQAVRRAAEDLVAELRP